MSEFESFLLYMSESLYDIDRDKDRLQEFLEVGVKLLNKLERSFVKTKDAEKLKKLRKKITETKQYISRIKRGMRKSESDIVKLSKYIEQTKEVKLIIMAHKIEEVDKCQFMSSDALTVKKFSKKFLPRKKRKKKKK